MGAGKKKVAMLGSLDPPQLRSRKANNISYLEHSSLYGAPGDGRVVLVEDW